MRLSRAAILLVLLSAWNGASAQDTPPPDDKTPVASDNIGYYGVDICREEDPGGQQLTGLRFDAGSTDSPDADSDGHAETSITILGGEGQHTYRATLGVAMTLFAIKEVLVAPRLGAGFEYRTSDPDSGWAGLLGFGLEMSGWIQKKVQVALFVDRNFGFPSGTRNQFGLAVRWRAKRLPWWPKGKPGQTP